MFITIPVRIGSRSSNNSGVSLGVFKHGPSYIEWMKQAAKRYKSIKKISK